MSPRNRRNVRKTTVTVERAAEIAALSPDELEPYAVNLGAALKSAYPQSATESEELTALIERHPSIHDFALESAGFEKQATGAWMRVKSDGPKPPPPPPPPDEKGEE